MSSRRNTLSYERQKETETSHNKAANDLYALWRR
jgi:hypothetical protein